MSRSKRYTRNLGRRLVAPLAWRSTVEWVRFEHVAEPYGVFSYLGDARRELDDDRRGELGAIVGWFNEHLGAPVSADEERFWFDAAATEHVARARRLAELVRAAGIPIVERRTRRVPGKVRWADAEQVAVLTYRDAPRPLGRRPR